MRDQIRAIDLANRIRLKRGQMSAYCFVIVEGEDDSKFYGRFSHALTRIEIAHGKPRALEAIDALAADQVPGLLAVVDADHAHIEGDKFPANVVVTDFHDLECVLLSSRAFALVLREVGSDDLIGQFEASHSRSVRDHLVAVCEDLGLLRLASARRGWQLKFDGLAFERFVSEKDVALDPMALLEEVRRHQGGRLGPPPTIEDMSTAVLELRGEAHSAWQICCGHDLVQVLSIALRRAWGRRNPSEVTPSRLETMLRLAYAEIDFCSTQLHARIRAWEGVNSPYRAICEGLGGLTSR